MTSRLYIPIMMALWAIHFNEAFTTHNTKSTAAFSSTSKIQPNQPYQKQHQQKPCQFQNQSSDTNSHQYQYQYKYHHLTTKNNQRSNTELMFEPNSNDPKKEAKAALDSGFWNALSYTEQWISDTLKDASSGTNGKSNPYARKELNYVCEMNDQTLMAVAGIFRRFREAREMGERHSAAEDRMVQRDPTHEKTLLRQTQVIIVPFCDYFSTFRAFEGVIQAINLARKNARDLVTDVAIEKMENYEKEWNVSINGASLHPRYGEKTPKEIMEELEIITEDGDVDMNIVESMQRRNQARRSPYPTLIVEIQASPPLTLEEQNERSRYSNSAANSASMPMTDDDDDLAKRGVLKDIVLKLESIFAKSAALHKKTEIKQEDSEDSFYNAIGRVAGVEEILASNPISSAQQWVIENDRLYNQNISSFASADVTHADSAFEFVFSNLAMNRYSPYIGGKRKNYDISSRSYLIMPKFVSSSATSLEKFMMDVKNIIDAIDGLNERVSLSLMHPEHIRIEKQSPVPILVLQWYAAKDE